MIKVFRNRNDGIVVSMNCGKSFHIDSKAVFTSAMLDGFGVLTKTERSRDVLAVLGALDFALCTGPSLLPHPLFPLHPSSLHPIDLVKYSIGLIPVKADLC